jgi:S1-C subfamily serine protease
MKGSRIFLFALLFGMAFVWITSRPNWSLLNIFSPLVRRAAVWSDPSSVSGAGLSADELNNIDIYKRARQATVYISSTTVQRDFFFQPYTSQNLGSGFVINEDGFILTNYHVISGGRQVRVTMEDQSQYDATPLDIDRTDDLALIRIKPRKQLTFLSLGDSDRLQVGLKVLAIGNPFGLEGTLTTGVVSSIGRTIQANEGNRLEGMIQTDAAINGGNSGGPLLDSAASVIGINTAILGEKNMGIGFALPINRAKALLEDYRAGRVTERPHLGASTAYVAGDLARALGLPERGGLLIQRIQPNSSAAAAGLQGAQQAVLIGNDQIGIGGDLIVEADGHPINREDSLVRILARKRVGDNLDLTVVRNGRTLRVRIKLLRAPLEQAGF